MDQPKTQESAIDLIDQAIISFLKSPENTMKNEANEKPWTDHLLGFSNGADPIFESYKEHVGPFHWTPLEAYQLAYPDDPVTAEELTVVSYILLQTEATKSDNRKQDKWPAERWARSRIFGEHANEALRRHVADALVDSGINASAPTLIPEWSTEQSEKFFIASKWSERHAAHASGLGTFGLCDGLITAKGKAMRAGSVIARVNIEATPRPYDHHQAYCLFFTENECGECIKRCPVNALSKKGGHDKPICLAFLNKTAKYVEENYKFVGYGCGLCQTGVPCESKIPQLSDLAQY